MSKPVGLVLGLFLTGFEIIVLVLTWPRHNIKALFCPAQNIKLARHFNDWLDKRTSDNCLKGTILN